MGIWLKILLCVAVAVVGWFAFRPVGVATKTREVADAFGGRKKTEEDAILWRKGRGAAYIAVSVALFGLIGLFGGGLGVCPNGHIGLGLFLGVPTGHVYEPGAYYVAPILGGVHAENVQLTARTRTVAAASSDQQDVEARVTVNFRVRADQVLSLFKTYRGAWRTEVLDPAIEFYAKAGTALYTPLSLLQNRPLVAKTILDSLQAAPTLAPFEIAAVNVENLLFSANYTKAIEDKMVAEQKAQEAQNKLTQVEIEAKQTVARATADAEQIRIQAEAIDKQGGAAYVALQAINKWDGHFPATLIQGGDATSPFQILDVGALIGK